MSDTIPSVRSARGSKKRSLRTMWARLRTVPGLGRDVSALVVAVILGLVTVVIVLNGEQFTFPWSPTLTSYTVDFQNAVAVAPGTGQEVRIAGVVVGKVLNTRPAPDGRSSEVTIALKPGHPLYANATAVLTPANPLNEMFIEVNPGGPPGALLAKHGAIPITQTHLPVQLDSVLDHLNANTRQAATTLLDTSAVALASGPASLPSGLANTDQTLKELQPVVTALQTRRQEIAQLVTAFSQISAGVGDNDTQLAALVDSAQQTLGVLGSHDTASAAQGPPSLGSPHPSPTRSRSSCLTPKTSATWPRSRSRGPRWVTSRAPPSKPMPPRSRPLFRARLHPFTRAYRSRSTSGPWSANRS